VQIQLTKFNEAWRELKPESLEFLHLQ